MLNSVIFLRIYSNEKMLIIKMKLLIIMIIYVYWKSKILQQSYEKNIHQLRLSFIEICQILFGPPILKIY
jgi:hypothetical protein